MPDRLVIDANVTISALINKGTSFSALITNAVLKKVELIAPEFLIEEMRNHESDLRRLSRLSPTEFREIRQFLMDEITFIPADDFINFLPQAEILAPHLKDAPYIALALATGAPILSGDKGLRNSKLDVLSPAEFLDVLMR